MRPITKTLAIVSLLSLGACVGTVEGTGTGGDDDDDGMGSGSNMPPPVTCDQARTYTNFGGKDLTADRPKIAAGTDRMRMKPFGSLASEYNRALGITGFNTAAYAGVFGKPPIRWYEEPQASAATIYSSFALAFDGCSQATATGADYTMAPSATVADRLCRDFARKAWNREMTDDEASHCATYAVNTNSADPPQKRWAYACASVLTASSFIAY